MSTRIEKLQFGRFEKWGLVLLLTSFAFHAGAAHYINSLDDAPNHDETVSILAATGNQKTSAQMIEQSPTWKSAQAWQSLTAAPRSLKLGVVRRDLSHHDIHPPLYFQLLHLSYFSTRVSQAVGVWLNIFFAGGVTCLLVWLGSQLGLRLAHSMLAGVFWLCSPAAWTVTTHLRQYQLFAFIAVATVGVGMRIVHDQQTRGELTWSSWLAGIAVVWLGLLTHYYQALVLVAVGSALLVASRRPYRETLLNLIGIGTVGAALFVGSHPDFWKSILQQQQQIQGFTVSELVFRIVAFPASLLDYWTFVRLDRFHFGTAVIVPVAIAMIGGALWQLYLCSDYHPISDVWDQQTPSSKLLTWFTLFWFGFQYLSYIGFLTPFHSIGTKYFATFWPLLSLGLVLLGIGMPSQGRKWLAGSLLLILLSSGYRIMEVHFRENMHSLEQGRQTLSEANVILFNHNQMGHVLPGLWHASREASVWVPSDDSGPQVPREPPPARESTAKTIVIVTRDRRWANVPPQRFIKNSSQLWGSDVDFRSIGKLDRGATVWELLVDKTSSADRSSHR